MDHRSQKDKNIFSLRARGAQAALAAAWLLVSTPAQGFGFDDVAAQAQALAARPYKAPPLAEARLRALDYDAHRDIRFRPTRAIWRDSGSPFELQLFHAGGYHPHVVRLYEVVDGRARALQVPPDAFHYGPRFGGPQPAAPQVAGFRVHFPLNRPEYKDELVAFLGASYFRALGAGQGYGLSARAVAVDTAGGRGEEFPLFEAFWLERPKPDATTLTVHALLNGPRVTGAYRFVLRPGTSTIVDVKARLFLRAPVATLGIAPLTSMFLSGENQPRAGDFRPEVHDSDGLQLATVGGEWIWRPLVNPAGTLTTSFALPGVQGFGLMQRDRAFASYEDTEARYERRPSAWVEPVGDWGAGRVELMQFHTEDEFTDNVAAYWVPKALPPLGQPLDVAWRVHWQGAQMQRPPAASVVQTRRGQGALALKPGEMQYVVDFAGGALATLDEEAPVQAVVTGDKNAKVVRTHVYRHPVTGAWRMTVNLRRGDRDQPAELRAFLKLDGHALSETWSYVVPGE